MTYIADVDKTDAGCVFCGKVPQEDDRKNLILHRGITCFVIMNLFPYNNGHLMVIPYAHIAEIGGIDRETSSELWGLLCRAQKALKETIHPDGFNIGINLGGQRGPGSIPTCMRISFPAGTGTPTSCRSSARPR